MSHPSKAWLIPICLFSYFSMGQAGCQTMPQNDMTYVRSDIVRLRHDVEGIKNKLEEGPVGSGSAESVLRNQATQREILHELQEGQQRTESRLDETNHQLATMSQEITNLKLNLIRQMESLRAQTKGASVIQPRAMPRAAKSSLQAPKPGASAPKPPARPKEVAAPTASKPQAAPVEPIDYTKLYDTAYEDYQRQNYSLARNGFEEYLRLFSDTDLADNAQYWIGECYYAEGRYEEAAEAFKEVITKYPTGNKVPRAMLKAGHASLQLGRKDHARSMFQQVIDAYPLSSEADQARSRLKKLD